MKISSNIIDSVYYQNDEPVTFRRIYGGIGWPAETYGAAIIIGEEQLGQTLRYYMLGEITAETNLSLIKQIQDFELRQRKAIRVDEWFGRINEDVENMLIQVNSTAFQKRRPQLSVSEAPGNNDQIVYQVETILSLLSPKRLWFFDESSVPATLQGLPKKLHGLKNEQYPTVAALGYVLTAFVDYPYDTGGHAVQMDARVY